MMGEHPVAAAQPAWARRCGVAHCLTHCLPPYATFRFYEWVSKDEVDGPKKKSVKQPYYVYYEPDEKDSAAEATPGPEGSEESKEAEAPVFTSKSFDGHPLMLAGLYDKWENADGEAVYSYTILTTNVCERLK